MLIVFRAMISIILAIIMILLFQKGFEIPGIEILALPELSHYILGCFFGLIFFILFSPYFAKSLLKKIQELEDHITKMSAKEIASSVLGIILGLIVANLLGITMWQFGILGTIVVIVLNIILAYLGFRISYRKKEDVDEIIENISTYARSEKVVDSNIENLSLIRAKILDTSVIIDGRILELLMTGFIEGKIIIPSFILQELRHIADSSDSLKRVRGRRGLDILNEIQNQVIAEVEIIDWKPSEFLEVDLKLLKMTEELNAIVVTNDYNLSKVADVQGITVININEIARALKPIVLPHEKLEVLVVKKGKEKKQGVAYLDDGTMIVIEDADDKIDKIIEVEITSVLQTSSGRMIFAKT